LILLIYKYFILFPLSSSDILHGGKNSGLDKFKRSKVMNFKIKRTNIICLEVLTIMTFPTTYLIYVLTP